MILSKAESKESKAKRGKKCKAKRKITLIEMIWKTINVSFVELKQYLETWEGGLFYLKLLSMTIPEI